MSPPIFKQLTFPEAQKAAAAENKLVLVDFSAEWCQPCKHMDRTTWVAPEVVAWIEANAIAIQLDGESSPLAKDWTVQAYPTLILFRGEKELDRTTGARPAEALLRWLDRVKAGRTELDELRSLPKEDPSSQLQLARALVRQHLDDEALEVFAWLWEHSLAHNPAWVGVRSSFMLGALEPLLERSSRARERFRQFRDSAAALLDAGHFFDFVRLNQLLKDDERTLTWLRGLTTERAHALPLHRDTRLQKLVEKHGEFALYGRLMTKPLLALEDEKMRLEHIRENRIEGDSEDEHLELVQMFEERFEQFVSLLSRSLNAADRHDDAAAVASWLAALPKR